VREVGCGQRPGGKPNDPPGKPVGFGGAARTMTLMKQRPPHLRVSDFEILYSNLFRISKFGFRICPLVWLRPTAAPR
jgi:hypothetical protein